MERKGRLTMLVVSIRHNVQGISQVLESLNRGDREQTFPKALTRHYRAIEHDARVAGLARFAELLARAKDAAEFVLDRALGPDLAEVLTELTGELVRVADALEAGRTHALEPSLAQRLDSVLQRPRD